MKTYSRPEINLLAFLTSASDGVKWSASRSGSLTHGETAPDTYWSENLWLQWSIQNGSENKNLAPAKYGALIVHFVDSHFNEFIEQLVSRILGL
jgi:hypothetical protein